MNDRYQLVLGDARRTTEIPPDIDAIITDPPYHCTKTDCEELLDWFLEATRGAVIVFADPATRWPTWIKGMQTLYWVKPLSTKNTRLRYARFVEVIHVYLAGAWNADGHWSRYANVFSDRLEHRWHPHQKPVSLCRRLVLNHTRPNDVVLDPFMGSGSIGVACLQTGRRYVGVECDEDYMRLASNRLQKELGL